MRLALPALLRAFDVGAVVNIGGTLIRTSAITAMVDAGTKIECYVGAQFYQFDGDNLGDARTLLRAFEQHTIY